jgi:hypothetical protein
MHLSIEFPATDFVSSLPDAPPIERAETRLVIDLQADPADVHDIIDRMIQWDACPKWWGILEPVNNDPDAWPDTCVGGILKIDEFLWVDNPPEDYLNTGGSACEKFAPPGRDALIRSRPRTCIARLESAVALRVKLRPLFAPMRGDYHAIVYRGRKLPGYATWFPLERDSILRGYGTRFLPTCLRCGASYGLPYSCYFLNSDQAIESRLYCDGDGSGHYGLGFQLFVPRSTASDVASIVGKAAGFQPVHSPTSSVGALAIDIAERLSVFPAAMERKVVRSTI